MVRLTNINPGSPPPTSRRSKVVNGAFVGQFSTRSQPAHALWRGLQAKEAFVQAGGKVSVYLQRRFCPNNAFLLGGASQNTDALIKKGDFKPLGAANAGAYLGQPSDSTISFVSRTIGIENGGFKRSEKGFILFNGRAIVGEVKINWLKKEMRTLGYQFELAIIPPEPRIAINPATNQKDPDHDRSDPRAYYLAINIVVPVSEGTSELAGAVSSPEALLRQFLETIPDASGDSPTMDQTAAFMREVKAEMIDRVGGLSAYQWHRLS